MEQHWKELLPIDRYIVRTADILHEYDRKILTLLYQPLIGAHAFSLYLTLWSELEQNRIWSEENTHHSIMILQRSNLKDIYNERLKLEGIGLLKTYVNHEADSRLFIYELQAPLTPSKFFNDGMLNVYLYNRLGKNKFLKLKRFFSDAEIDKVEFNPITKSFSEVFASLKPSEMATSMNEETYHDLSRDAGQNFITTRSNGNQLEVKNDTFDFELFFAGISEVMIPQKSVTLKVKEAIKKLSFLYGINPIEMQTIAMSALEHDDTIDIEKLRKAARDWYQFENGKELPSLSERVQPPPYRTAEEHEPKTKDEKLIQQLEVISPKRLLIDISGGAEPAVGDLQIVEEVMFKQKLLPGVVNVLIYYVMLRTDMKLSKSYVQKIASHWARKQIKTVKEAMDLAKQEHNQYQTWAAAPKKSPSRGKAVRTEILPDWLDQDQNNANEPEAKTDLQFEEDKRKLEEVLKKYKKNSN